LRTAVGVFGSTAGHRMKKQVGEHWEAEWFNLASIKPNIMPIELCCSQLLLYGKSDYFAT